MFSASCSHVDFHFVPESWEFCPSYRKLILMIPVSSSALCARKARYGTLVFMNTFTGFLFCFVLLGGKGGGRVLVQHSYCFIFSHIWLPQISLSRIRYISVISKWVCNILSQLCGAGLAFVLILSVVWVGICPYLIIVVWGWPLYSSYHTCVGLTFVLILSQLCRVGLCLHLFTVLWGLPVSSTEDLQFMIGCYDNLWLDQPVVDNVQTDSTFAHSS